MRAAMLETAQFDQALEFTNTMERPAMYRLLILLSRDLGLRPIELAKMERSWFRGGELRIVSGKSKRGVARSLPVSEEIIQALDDHMLDRQGTVFLNRYNEPFTPGTIGDAVTRMYRRAGIQACTYSGRRTLASNLVDKGANILVVQAVLGHASAATTEKYVTVTDKMLRKALFA